MLKSLTVWNFALLEHVQIEFDAGLNILTGETGAGKSILIPSSATASRLTPSVRAAIGCASRLSLHWMGSRRCRSCCSHRPSTSVRMC